MAAKQLVADNADIEARLLMLSDMLADGDMRPEDYRKQSRRLRTQLDQNNAQLSTLRSTSVLDSLGGQVRERWEELSTEDRRTVLLAIVPKIEVDRGHGAPRDRVHFHWTSAAWENVLDLTPEAGGTYSIKSLGIGSQSPPEAVAVASMGVEADGA